MLQEDKTNAVRLLKSLAEGLGYDVRERVTKQIAIVMMPKLGIDKPYNTMTSQQLTSELKIVEDMIHKFNAENDGLKQQLALFFDTEPKDITANMFIGTKFDPGKLRLVDEELNEYQALKEYLEEQKKAAIETEIRARFIGLHPEYKQLIQKMGRITTEVGIALRVDISRGLLNPVKSKDSPEDKKKPKK